MAAAAAELQHLDKVHDAMCRGLWTTGLATGQLRTAFKTAFEEAGGVVNNLKLIDVESDTVIGETFATLESLTVSDLERLAEGFITTDGDARLFYSDQNILMDPQHMCQYYGYTTFPPAQRTIYCRRDTSRRSISVREKAKRDANEAERQRLIKAFREDIRLENSIRSHRINPAFRTGVSEPRGIDHMTIQQLKWERKMFHDSHFDPF
jgi:hypothetical protein